MGLRTREIRENKTLAKITAYTVIRWCPYFRNVRNGALSLMDCDKTST